MEWLTNPDIWMSFLTLCVLEIILGIDNIIFISIISQKLPKEQQGKARTWGLAFALITRILLLLSITWIMQLKSALFTVFDNDISGRDIILILGGLFLIYKSVNEIHEKIENAAQPEMKDLKKVTFWSVISQIILIDIIFSLDSVITAVGMADHVEVMIAAVIVSVIIMMLAINKISSFVDENPTIKVLALSFLIMIGLALLADGLDFHIPKGYIYFSMAFALMVEAVNITISKRKRKSLNN